MPDTASHPTAGIDIDLFTDEELAAMADGRDPFAEADCFVCNGRGSVLLDNRGDAEGPCPNCQPPARAEPFDPFAEPLPDSDDTSLAGRDGQRAGALLKGSVAGGRDVLHRLADTAVRRLLADDDWQSHSVLFTDDELAELRDSLAAVRANGDLLGRARVRRLAEIAARQAEPVKFAEGYKAFDCPKCGGVMYDGHPERKTRYQFSALCEACGHRCGNSGLTPATQRFAEPAPEDPFAAFADETLPVHRPQAAADYFRRLVPRLGVRPERYAPYFDRQAFTMATAADDALLNKVKQVIQDALDNGASRADVAAKVDDLLDAAGVSSRNPQYSDLVYRTNAMDSFQSGQLAEYRDPLIQEQFPAWEYAAIPDERSRPHHSARNGLLYPFSLSFHEVRGTDPSDTINCRCSFTPIHRRELERRIADGETIQDE